MPIISPSSYNPPRFMKNGHFQTIYASLFRSVRGVHYDRQRVETPDGDFLDLDYSRVGARRIAVICHGLEGSSSRQYILGMVRAVNRRGWDALAWSFRGCSGEPNRKLRFYHSGETGDLQHVVSLVHGAGEYDEVYLIGFSLGGNVILKYLGERGQRAVPEIAAAVVFSVPCDLKSSAVKMSSLANRIYMRRFLKMLREKVRAKMDIFPGQIDDLNYGALRNFQDFDDRYTAPIHGFRDAEDYWERSSSKPYLPSIRVPTLLVNALDDPFLALDCYPYSAARENDCFFLETPPSGGHVGFVSNGDEYWSESRAAEFLRAHSARNPKLQVVG